MEIYVNGNPVEETGDEKASVREVIEALNDWLAGQGAVIVSARLDGDVLDLANETAEVLNSAPANHRRLEIEAQNARLLVIETMNDLGNYLDRVARLCPTLMERDDPRSDIENLKEGLQWSLDVLERVEGILGLSYKEIEFEEDRIRKYVLRLGDVLDHVRVAVEEQNRPALEALLRDTLPALCDSLVRAIPTILRAGNLEPTDTTLADDIEEILGMVTGLPERLEAIAVKISMGNAAEGMEEFASAVSILEKAFVCVERSRRELPLSREDLMVDGQDFEERAKRISGVLDEMIEAFEKKDRILISDLIEYEIAPEIEVITRLLERARNFLKGSCH
ncbi:MAG: hypothetical protein D6679_00500 [Candidatus Hydrogenedentota bacterium]|nr:MAG: hypothetical protein D6679_00500 [Candidatus Hydrogenedentota bacterium]